MARLNRWGAQKPPAGVQVGNGPLTIGLEDLWLNNEGATFAHDLVTKREGTSSAFPPTKYTLWGSSREFDGSVSSRRIDYTVRALPDGHDYTVWALVVPTSYPEFGEILSADPQNADRNFQFRMEQTTGRPTFIPFNTANATFTAQVVVTPALLSRVSMAAGIRGGTGVFINYNGVEGTNTLTGTVRSSHAAIRMGMSISTLFGNIQRFHGHVIAAARWSRGLTKEEIAILDASPWDALLAPPTSRSVFSVPNVTVIPKKVVFLTGVGAGTWEVPEDFATLVSIECIGGGGAGGGAETSGGFRGGGGAGGGAYSKITSLALTPAQMVDYSIGAGGAAAANTNGGSGGDTFFGDAVYANADVAAKGGGGGTRGADGGAAGAGGAASAGIGSLKRSGGSGSLGGSGGGTQAGAGGGAAGWRGNGGGGGVIGAGASGAGGGGAGGGITGTDGFQGGNGSSSTSGAGGNNAAGAGGATGVAPDNPGNAGTVGGGGSGGSDGAGGDGGPGADWIQTSDEAVAGAGGGGGAGYGADSNISGRGVGGDGGLYGGGGAGGMGYGALGDGSRGGHGAQGIIVITYLPATNLDVEYTGVGGALASGVATLRILFIIPGVGEVQAAGDGVHVVAWSVPGVGGSRAAGDIVLQYVADYVGVGGAQAAGSLADDGFEIMGTTRDSSGTPIPNCVVKLYRTNDDSVEAETISDGSGVYRFVVATNAFRYYLVAYKVGTPDRFGTTLNTIQPQEI